MNLGIPVRVDPEIQQNSQGGTSNIQLVGGIFSRPTPPQKKKSIYIGCISMFNFECEQLFGVFVDSSPKETPAIRHRHVWEVPFVQTRTKKAAAWGFFWDGKVGRKVHGRFADTKKTGVKGWKILNSIDFLHSINDHKCINHLVAMPDSTVEAIYIEIRKQLSMTFKYFSLRLHVSSIAT